MIKKRIIPLVIIIVCWGLIGVYNDNFLRSEPAGENSILEKINPLPYLVYFDLSSNKPHAIFQTPTLPQYNNYCHEKGKPCLFIPFQQLYADIMRISSIQYIGVNLGQNGDRGLYTLLDTLTTLSPFWPYPYGFAQLVVPMQKTIDEGENAEELAAIRKGSWENSTKLAQKGEYFLCDADKIAGITGMTQQEFIDTVYQKDQSPYHNPCKSYEIPHYMAFNYFYFMQDAENAAMQYRISAFHDEAPSLTPLMSALVYGRGGEHLKSATLWFDRYASLIGSEDDINSADAERSLQKAIFEIQLQLITEAADQHPECGTSYACLQRNGSIRQSIQTSWNKTCQSGRDQQNIRCVLMQAWLREGYITLNGQLIYPLDPTFDFLWSKEYNSRWAQPHRE